LPYDDEIKMNLDFRPASVFGGVHTAIWLFLIHKIGDEFQTFDQLRASIANAQKNGGTFRYLVDGLPGLEGPDIELGHKIVVRSVPSTGELIAYVEILGALKVGGLYGRMKPGHLIEHIYAYDLLERKDRSSEFAIDAKTFDTKSWRMAGFGLSDAKTIRDCILKEQRRLEDIYRRRASPPAA
jgi:hypothetical protein